MARQHGYILLPVVLLITLVAAVAFMINNESALDSGITGSKAEAKQVEYIAQAGLQHALWANNNSGCAGDLAMTTVPFGQAGINNYTATVTTPGGSTTAYANLAADQDAWFRSDNITNNNGGTATYHLRMESGNLEYAMVRFDLLTLPAGAQVNSAIARFYVRPTKGHPEGPVTVHRVTADWTENGATWETMSDKFDSTVLAVIPAQPDSGGNWVEINLTTQVQAWVNAGEANYGIMLIPTGEGTHGEYVSREGAANQQPQLDVIVGTGPATPATITATGTLTGNPSPANDITRTLTRSIVPAYQTLSYQLLQPGAALGKDAYIWKAHMTTNYGTDDETWVSTGNTNESASLFQFNVEAIPSGARIQQATLSLYHRSGNDSNVPVTAHRITKSWEEDVVTWNERKTGTAWGTAGGDSDATIVATTSVGPASGIRYQWDIASLVQGWVNGTYENEGVVLRTVEPGTLGERFDTSDHADPTRHPQLSISYACECGNTCLAPQGSGNILMVVSNEWWMTQDELKKKASFEGWGYTVNLISQWDVSWNFDALAVNNDVVYVSEGVDHTTWGMMPKLAATTLGVVNEEGQLNADLGISDNAVVTVGSVLNITNINHYITVPFPAGPLEIYHVGMEQLVISSGLAPDRQTLADVGGSGSLVLLETGAALGGNKIGENAAGRRVMLPLGTEAKFNWDYLNSNGRLMVQRAIQWGASVTAVAPPPTYNVLMIVGNLSLSSKDVGYKALMESWGHTVSLLDDGASQTSYNTAMDAADVILASGSAIGSSMLDKATFTTKGLVNEVNGKIDNFGFSSSTAATANFDTFSITNPGHYITEPFAGNPVTVFTSSLTNPVPGGTLAPDLQKVGFAGSTLVLATLDTGETRYDSNPSPGRRAHLPFTLAETTDLTADGKTILQRSLEWAAGASSAPTGPLAHWKLDDAAGITAIDSVGGHDGTLINTAPLWAAGQVDGALDLDGVNDYINVPHNDALSLTETLTFIAWINASSFGSSYQTIIAKDGGGAGSNYWFGTWQQELAFGFFAGGTFREVFTSGLNLQPGTWYQLAATFDNASDEVRLYVDGAEVHSGTLAFSPTAVAADLAIGRSPDGERWRGLLDDVRIYDSVLTAGEIAGLYTAGGGGGGGLSGTYLDQFNAIAYNGDDGTLSWSNDWQETGESDGPGGGDFTVVNNAWCASPNCLQIREDRASARHLSREVDMTDAVSATLSLNYRRRNVGTPTGGTIKLEISDNGGSSFTQLKVYDMATQDATQQFDSFDISAYIAPDTQLRFSTSNALFETALYLDNVLIDTTGGGGGGGASCDGTFRDEFNTVSFSNNDGTLNWAGDWLEVGESDGPGSNDVQVRDDNGAYQLWLRDNQNGGEGAEREADLSGATAATLSFDYRRSGLDNANDYVKLEISANGTAGPWTELTRFQGSATDSAYQPFSQDISGYISANTRIRLITSPTMGNMDLVIFDNIEIACSP